MNIGRLGARRTRPIPCHSGQSNPKNGKGGWKPINVFYEHDYPQAVAGMRLYDVLLVNPVADGMNLVAKEGPVVNARDGVLVLSEEAGAHEQLNGDCLSIEPTDIEGTMQALYRALTMPKLEKRQRAERLRRRIRGQDITWWLETQLQDLRELAEQSPLPGMIVDEKVFASADLRVASHHT